MQNILSDINVWTLFLEGLTSVFSPCVLPLLPLYLGYLTSSKEKGWFKSILNTSLFVLGFCTTFFIFGLAATSLSPLLKAYSHWIKLFGGILLILLALYTLQIIQIPFLSKLKLKDIDISSGITAFKSWLMGFVFSFCFSPCTGPMLAQAVLLASSSDSKLKGWLYICAYSLGFIIAFLILGVVILKFKDKYSKYSKFSKYAAILAGLLIMFSGAYMSYRGIQEMNYIKSQAETKAQEQNTAQSEDVQNDANHVYTAEELLDTNLNSHIKINDLDFTLIDNKGNEFNLVKKSQGKPTILLFSTTWCPYCESQVKTLVDIKQKYGDDVVIAIIDPPLSEYGASADDIYKHFEEYNINFPVLLDENGELDFRFSVSGFPTFVFFDKNSSVALYMPGALSEELLYNIVEELVKGD